MDFILNELSLNGQYSTADEFYSSGLSQMNGILAEIRADDASLILKKSDFYSREVTPGVQFYQLLHNKEARINDAIRRLKISMSALQNRPFWDEEPQQDSAIGYRRVDQGLEADVSGSGVAEAFARGVCTVSFCKSDYETDTIAIKCSDDDEEDDPHLIRNLHRPGMLPDALFASGAIGIDGYIRKKFCTKLDFSEADGAHGLNLVDNVNGTLFIESFRNFEAKDWQQILTDKGLDYKPFSKNRNTKRFFSPEQWRRGVYKFRIDQEKRCFGHREGDVFHVWRIDLDHILSDLG